MISLINGIIALFQNILIMSISAAVLTGIILLIRLTVGRWMSNRSKAHLISAVLNFLAMMAILSVRKITMAVQHLCFTLIAQLKLLTRSTERQDWKTISTVSHSTTKTATYSG